MAAALPGLTLVNSYGATETTSPTSIIPLGEQETISTALGGSSLAGVSGWSTKTNAKCPSESLAKSGSPAQWSCLAIGATTRLNLSSFADGHWKSGDIGSIDEQGYLKVVDRKKDMVNRGGYKVYSVEVENVISHHPQVLEVAIIAHPDSVLGEPVMRLSLAKAA